MRLVASGALAAASYRWLEQPIRTRRRLASDARMVASSAVAAVSVAAVAGLGSLGATPTASATAAVGAGFTDFGATARPAAFDSTLPPVSATEPPARARIAVIGGVAADTVAREIAGDAVVVRIRCELDACVTDADIDGTTDAAAVVLGAGDRATVAGLTGDRQVDAFVALAESLAAVVDGATASGVPVVLADAGPDDFLRSRLGVLDLSSELVVAVDPADAATTATVAATPGTDPAPDDRLAVMVIGDSTPYGIADGLHAAAGDRLHVLWAGGANCALVPAERMRWWEGNEFDTGDCPTADAWAEAAAGFRPDVVLVVSSFAEQTELRLPGHDGWSVAGDPAFAAAHDRWLDDVLTIAARTGAVVAIADSPPFAEGSFAGAPMALPERIDAWNAQIAAWDVAHADVVAVPWTAMLASMEASGSVRSDGVHLDHADRPRAGALVADALVGIVARLPASANG